ncbi:MAG: hypothetical protein Q7T10_16275 [Rhodoferax sp.]|uniref:hypothetical protein n=1 Tax=Rhodoferax sp. TaxID=50421 RepID=UPI00271B2BE0|nr:hypothetical protein [Rhodoferax sp.]MDO8450356.1 hypothetical protein [Rhodoferax sp.]
MTTWLHDHPAIRALPRLWVERVWLLESREPLTITREVGLRPGVNVVWAREPESDTGSGLASAGHGVGKTSFCLLLRYLLGDEATAITALREKAAANFPKGGVAARVHIDDVTWLVYRPYGAYSHPIAKVGEQLESLFEGQLAGDFQTYLSSLQAEFIGKLAAQTLPGTNQSLEWRHLLAWCIREQRTRFDGFFHWREGDGLGFRRSRQDPPLFVSSVLGVLDTDADRMIREVESIQADLTRLQGQIPELERQPIYALEHLEQRLRVQVGAGEDEPIFESMVDASLQSKVNEAIAAAERAESQGNSEVGAAEEAMAPMLVKLAELQAEFNRFDIERGIAKSLVEANEADYTRLTTELIELERLTGQCKHGLVEFSDCEHIKNRHSTVSLPWRMDALAAKDATPRRQTQLNAASIAADAAKQALSEQRSRVDSQRAIARRAQMRSASSTLRREQLKQQWDELLLRTRQREERVDSAELTRARARVKALTSELESQRVALLKRKQQQSTRVDSLKALTLLIAERLLGEAGHGRFVPDSDSRPFDLSRGGEAYQVLEVLLGDITCLLDAATSTGNNHPGFLVHDCPREADMSAVLYKNFLMMVMEAEKQLSRSGNVPFQYIVTTTSAPPLELCEVPYLTLELQPGSDDHLLFKRQLITSLPGMESGSLE